MGTKYKLTEQQKEFLRYLQRRKRNGELHGEKYTFYSENNILIIGITRLSTIIKNGTYTDRDKDDLNELRKMYEKQYKNNE